MSFSAEEAPTKPSKPVKPGAEPVTDLGHYLKEPTDFEASALAAWNDDSVELSADEERFIEQARERVLSFAKDQALLDWLDAPEPEPWPEPLPGWRAQTVENSPVTWIASELDGKTWIVDGSTGDDTTDSAFPIVAKRTDQAALDADAPKQGYGPEEVFKRFLMNRSEDTLKAYKADVDAFAAWLGVSPDDAVGRLLGHGLGPANALVIEWLDSMHALSPATRKRRLSALRSVVRMARRLGAVEWSLDVDSPKAESYRDTAGPTEDQFHKLLEACGEGLEGLRNRALVLLAVFMAFRRRELAAFRLLDFDRNRRRVFIRGKGGKDKWVGLPDEVFDALVAWLDAPKTIIGEDNDAVFLSLSPRTFGKPLTRKGVYNIVTKIGERAGIDVWPHALRHAGITAALDASGGDVRMSQQFARHADPKTTLIYDDNRTDMGGRAAKLVAGKLMPKK